VPVAQIGNNKFDLSINRYKETQHQEQIYEHPRIIIERLRSLEQGISEKLETLETSLK